MTCRKLYQGDSRNLQFPITSDGVNPATLTAPQGTYTIGQFPSDPAPLLVLNGTFSQNTATGLWTMAVALSSANTLGLPIGSLWRQVNVWDIDGTYETVLAGPIDVYPAISQEAIAGFTPTSSSAALVALLTAGGTNSTLAQALATLIPQLPTDAVSTGATLHSNGGIPQFS